VEDATTTDREDVSDDEDGDPTEALSTTASTIACRDRTVTSLAALTPLDSDVNRRQQG